jgi:nitroreductase
LEVDIETVGEDLKLLEGIRSTRAIRRLLPDPVPKELIRKVCQAGTYAPSGGNRQPWYFIAVTEPERRSWVAERYRKVFHEYIAPALEAARAPDFPEARKRNIRAALELADGLH